MASDPQSVDQPASIAAPDSADAGPTGGAVPPRPRWLAWLAQHRRRLAPLVLVGGVALVAGPLSEAAPRATKVRVQLAEPEQVREVALSVLDAGEPIIGVRLAYERGAPARIDEELELAPGHYELRVEVTRAVAAGRDAPRDTGRTPPVAERWVRALEVPSAGTLVFDLSRGDA